MAIYPVQNNYVIDVDAFTSASYFSGMALVRDDNGRAVVADSQQLVFKNVIQKSGKFLGFAASDHDISGNTIIRPDVVGSSYLDSSYGFVQFKENEFLSPKRALADNLDETVSKFYNNTEILSTTRRGVAVYNQPGSIFITDQFKAVLHGDYGLDGLDTVTLNSGDLLTFGGGINAGKLVKVNTNSFGPDVLVIGIVEKHIPATGLLHFRQVNYSLSFGTNPYVLAIDAGNSASFTPNSTSVINLSTGTNGGTLNNGTSYFSQFYGSWVFDGTDDNILTVINSSLFTNDATMLLWLQLDSDPATNAGFTGLSGFNPSFAGITHYPWIDGTAYMTTFRSNRVNSISLSALDKSKPHLLVVTTNSTDWKLYQNTNLIITSASSGPVQLSNPYLGTTYPGSGYNYKGKIFQFSLLNQALTATQITNYYNATKGRYGL